MLTNLYFAQSQLGSAIKVGISRKPERRMKTIHAELICMFEMFQWPAQVLEASILDVFAEDRLAGEYLAPVPALVALIEIAKSQGLAAAEAEVVRLHAAKNELPPNFVFDLREAVTVIA